MQKLNCVDRSEAGWRGKGKGKGKRSGTKGAKKRMHSSEYALHALQDPMHDTVVHSPACCFSLSLAASPVCITEAQLSAHAESMSAQARLGNLTERSV